MVVCKYNKRYECIHSETFIAIIVIKNSVPLTPSH